MLEKGGVVTRVVLNGLKWQRRFVAHLGSIRACLDYLGSEMSYPWLYGGTGHAFVINVHEGVCPSGPTAWNTRMLFDLAPGLGYRAEGCKISRQDAGDAFAEKQREAWDFVRDSIDRGLPCYGFQFNDPDFCVVYGYDGEDYLYSGWGKGRLAWRKLGTWDVQVLEVYRVEPCSPAPDDKVVRDAFAMVIKHAENSEGWTQEPWHSGLDGFDVWAEALDSGKAMRDGQWYNAVVWYECRAMAVDFLAEARERLPGRCDKAFDAASVHYSTVRDKLKGLLDLHPQREDQDWQSTFASPNGATLVREAGAAEREGLECLRRIAATL